MKKIKWIKRLSWWLLNKKATTELIKEILAINEVEISLVVKMLEGLDQDKLYVAQLPSTTSAEDFQNVVKGFKIATNKLNWSGPHIVFTNQEIIITEKTKESKQ